MIIRVDKEKKLKVDKIKNFKFEKLLKKKKIPWKTAKT